MPSFRNRIQEAFRHLPGVQALIKERSRLIKELQDVTGELSRYRTWVPPGHFYSPIPSIEWIRAKEEMIFAAGAREIAGIDLHESEQLQLLDEFARYYPEIPFDRQKRNGLRYFFENPNYSYSDAIVYFCMLRHACPKRIIEIGSGYSSCVALDTNERVFENRIECTFIEPYPDLLRSLLRDGDEQRVRILEADLQEIHLGEFGRLDAGDVLFIDSTHVSKIDSDVNYIFFKILPSLKTGVLIHFHDVFFPFEYPKEWIYEGRAWNESYLLRAFLQFNDHFKIVFFNTFLQTYHRSRFAEQMPLCLENPGGSIWVRKER